MKRKAGMAVWVMLVSILFALGGCGGGGAADSGGNNTGGSYLISGKVTDSTGAGLAIVTVALSGASTASVATNSTGNFTFTGLANGTYAIAPSKSGSTFAPLSKAVSVNNANLSGQDFAGTVASGSTYTISGKVSDSSSAGMSGTTMTLSGANTGSTVTDSSGNYSFAGLGSGSYTVTPAKSGYTFNPSNRAVTVSSANSSGQDFAGSSTGGSGTDTTAPTVPAGLAVTVASASQLNLAWSASFDAVGVTGYKVYRGGTYLKTATGTSSSDTGLPASTQYCYQVTAYDAAGNESNKSAEVCATTAAAATASGSLDATFGTGGMETTDIGGRWDSASALGIQPDGKIVAAGYATIIGNNYGFALVRYNTDSSLDATFGTGGKVTTDFESDIDSAKVIGIQSDGKIVAAGYSYIFHSYGSNNDFALVRYNTDGSLDATFGTGGKVTTDIGGSWNYAYALSIQSDGKIVAAGGSNVVRYNTDGALDLTFGTGGKVTTSGSGATALSIQLDGKIVTAGGFNKDFTVARYNTDGRLWKW